MAAGYQGYGQGYGDPERVKLDRSRKLAELLQNNALDGSPKSLGSGLAQLGEAWLARGAIDKADKAETAYGDSVTKRNAAALAQIFADEPAGVAFNSETQSTQPTPATPNKYRAIAEALAPEVGLAGAIQAGQGAQRQGVEDERYADTTQYNRRRDDATDLHWQETFDKPNLSLEAGGNGNFWKFDPRTGDMVDTGVKAPPKELGGGSGGGVHAVSANYIDQATGEPRVLMSDGSWRSAGFKPAQNQIVDVGGVPTLVSKINGDNSQVVPTDLAAANAGAIAGGKVQGEAKANAQIALPNVMDNGNQALDTINSLVNHKSFSTRYGPGSYGPAIAGTPDAEVQALIEQVNGQSFLSVYDSLRGSGAITENESAAAKSARTRLGNQNISPDAAMRAAMELQSILQNGMRRAEQKAGKQTSAVPMYTPMQVQEAKQYLANWDTMPPAWRTPEARANAEAVLAGRPRGAQKKAPANQPAGDLSHLSDEEIDRMIAQGEGR